MHVREAAVLAPDALPEDLHAQGAGARGRRRPAPRGADEPFADWLGRIAGAAVAAARCSASGHDDALDVADPVGRGRADYEVTADLLDRPARRRSSTWPSPPAPEPRGSTREGRHRSRPRRRAT